MARQQINIGSSANDGTGDPLRTAFDKINDNLSEVYTNLGGDSLSNIGHTGNTIQSLDTNGNIVLSPNGTGTIEFPAISFNDNNISGNRSNENLNISASGTGNINMSSVMTTIGQTVTGNITVTGNEDITGNITVTGATDVDNIKLDGNTISTTNTNGNLILSPNGTGAVNVADVTINDHVIQASNSNQDLLLLGAGTGGVRVENLHVSESTISTLASNQDIILTPHGTASVVASGIKIRGTSLSADGSSVINVNETLNTGNITTDSITTTDATITTATVTTGTVTNLTSTQAEIGTVRTDKIQSETSNADIQVDTQGAGLVDFRTETQDTVGAVGAASKLPLDSANEVRPVGYLKIKVGGTEYVVPYFNAS